jgi:hypothetical protein
MRLQTLHHESRMLSARRERDGCVTASILDSRAGWKRPGSPLFPCRHEDPGQQLGRRSRGGAGVYAQDQFDPDEIFNMFFGGGGFGPRCAPEVSARQQPAACIFSLYCNRGTPHSTSAGALCSAW